MDHPEGPGLQRADRVDFDPRVRLSGLALGRAFPACRLHRHQPAHGAGLGGEVPQAARHRRAAH